MTPPPVSPAPARSTAQGAAARTAPGPVFRPELHGLRGVAVLLVALYHVFSDRVSGGVDVFLFLSAFLLAGTFSRRLDRGEPVRPLAHAARTVKRLLAPATVVVLATLVMVRALLPPSMWIPSLGDAAAALLQVENWRLALRGVDYYARDAGASPFQHFWSLSVQGQIFLLWPLLFAGCGVLARRLRRAPGPLLIGLFALITACSLAWSVHATAADQAFAYFDTAARAWEFSAGTLLGLLLPRLEEGRAAAPRARGATRPGRRRRTARIAAGWIGLLGLLTCGLVIDVQGAFPGWIAAWPLLCAALVLAAGSTGSRLGVDHLLAAPPVSFLGTVSYALYLVHWPLLVGWGAATGTARPGPAAGAGLIAVSVVLAWALTRAVDTPVRRWAWANASAGRTGAVVAACLAIGLLPIALVHQGLVRAEASQRSLAARDNPGARVLDPAFDPDPGADPEAPALPGAAFVAQDWMELAAPCPEDLAARGSEEIAIAEACRISEGAADAPVIVVVGSSRMQQHAAALVPLAASRGWRVVMLTRASCPYAPSIAQHLEDCNAVNRAVEHYLERTRPAAVATTTTLLTHDGREVLSPGAARHVPELLARGIDVLAFRDLPRLPLDPTTCVEEHGAEAAECAVPLEGMFAEVRPDAELLAAGTGPGRAIPVDLTGALCPDGVCRPVIGNVRVYLDADHSTATYGASLEGELGRGLEEEGWRW